MFFCCTDYREPGTCTYYRQHLGLRRINNKFVYYIDRRYMGVGNTFCSYN